MKTNTHTRPELAQDDVALRQRGSPAVYAATILASALLLFLVQPLIGKVILPWFGGSSAVWSTSMLFFQVLLLLGYLYSHLVVQRLAQRRQIIVHLGLLGLSLLLLLFNLMVWPTPITPGAAWAPRGDVAPVIRILWTLAVSVGLPYAVLSTTSPLVQAWFATRFSERSPYPLYALSNVGSLVALAGYPLVLEPALSVRAQANLWSVGYLVFALGLGAIAWSLFRRPPPVVPVSVPRSTVRRRARWGQMSLWLALSTTGSVLLLGATQQMTQNVAAVPLLWVVPLALYLLTFVITFSGGIGYGRWTLGLLFVATLAFSYVLPRGNRLPILVQLNVYALTLFAGCMVSHGELVRLRPDTDDLTAFYLVMALGGALGGVLVNLVAPLVFTDTWEFPLGLLAAWLFAGISLWLDKNSPLHGRFIVQATTVLALLFGLFITVGVVRLAVQSFYFATVDAERNFYGVLRIQSTELGDPPAAAYRLVHGTTIHGAQFVPEPLRDEPMTYFGPTSGVGLAMQAADDALSAKSVGVLGLGAGTLAAYGRTDDSFRFYEIDPNVIDYALGKGGYFDYLDRSPSDVEVVAGDARLMLERERAQGSVEPYDVLVVDVFSGDAPPVHLLTREAFELYLDRLVDDGLLAINISTTHLDLQPVLAALARHFNLEGVVIEDAGDGAAFFRSRWVLLSADPAWLRAASFSGFPDLQSFYDEGLRLWTDDYSNLVQIIR